MILHQFLFALLVFFGILRWIVIIDIVLSWSVLFGVQIRVPFIRNVLDPIYLHIRKRLPTSFHGIDFAPAILILLIVLCESAVIAFDPSVVLLL